MSSSWLLRSVAFVAVAAAIMGVIVGPGVRGNASEFVVLWTGRASATLAYLLAGMLMALVLRGALELVQTRVTLGVRVGLIAGGAAVVAISLPGLRDRLPGQLTLLIVSAAAVATLGASYYAARGPHTRATAAVLFAFSFATIARLGAWELATRAGDTANVALFGWAQRLATTGVIFEAMGQLTAFLWLGTRSRAFGQLGSFAALVGAGVVTWGVAGGVHSGAPAWQAVLHTALADPPGVPPWDRLGALSTLLAPASMLLALAVASQPGQVTVVISSMALALISRGAFDAPLRALCAVAAGQWVVLACVDERAMWTTLISDRKRRLAEDEGA